MRILVAEDDAVSLLIVRRAVEKLGHECLPAKSGGEAWRLYQENPDVDVIVSDWMMPDVDGLELCRRVRAESEERQNRYAYFIFLTALGDREDLLRGFEAGADDYLSKPLDRDELQVRLISARRLTALHRQLAEQRTELEELNARLADQARTDPLTHLGNRLQMREDIEVLHARTERYGHSYCAILCDVDHFKLYNDTYGHLAGDEALRLVARTVAQNVRRGDTIYRYGGEEFLALLPEQTLEASKRAAERIRGSVERLGITHGAKEPPGVLTISAGVAVLGGVEQRGPCMSDALLKEADEALYEAKEAGRNRVISRCDGV
ncbi:GGDEF domain-containing response regulator [Rubrobacter aplysinae]|uniref:GGDEF domain-containing response regulator n=1 Tax=Rubrobacter aplysinae TaxID=909625 RepID=UPI00064BFED1|nr:diguanylate cyclase [Rubrobacter aplysinae]